MPVSGEHLLDGTMGDDVAHRGSPVTSHDDAVAVTHRHHRRGVTRGRLGTRTGGRHLAVASFEYDRALFGDWGIAAFSDVGYVSNDWHGPVRTGVGLGARWRSPVGPVRLDVGVPLTQALDPVQVYLILGPDL